MALLGFYLTPTAPPRLMRSEGFVDVMSQTSAWGWWPASGAPASDALSNQFAAMPSLHSAWAAWCGIVVFVLGRRIWLRVLAVLYPMSTFLVVMGSGNHYLLDVVAGVVLLGLVGGVVLIGAQLMRDRRMSVLPGGPRLVAFETARSGLRVPRRPLGEVSSTSLESRPRRYRSPTERR